MKTEKEVLEIVKDLNSRFLGKYYDGKFIVAVEIYRSAKGFTFCRFDEDCEVVCFESFKFSDIDSIEVSNTPPADFKYFAFSDSRRVDNIVNSLIDEGVKGDRVDNSSEATSLEDLKKLLKERL